jgi:ribosomal protein S18 acetylase RimI-like enzyme
MLTGGLIIESARLDDQEAIVPLMVEFNRSEGIIWQAESTTAALRRLLGESELGLVMVARDHASRSLAGYAIATFGYDLEFAGRDAFVTELFVSPPFRGRHVGRALLGSLVEKLRAHHVLAVHLLVRPENAPARALYESLAFTSSPRIMMTRKL